MVSAPRYDLTDLRLFISIAQAKSLTRGAEGVNLSLSAASIRIKNMEATFGSPLLVRENQGVSLTPLGEVLSSYALRIFRDIERLHGEMQQFGAGVRGSIQIFANTTAVTETLPRVLRKYLPEHPLIDVHIEEKLSSEIVRSIGEGVGDIGIFAGDIHAEGLQIIELRTDRLVLAVPEDHRLSGREAVAFSELLSENFVALQRGSAIVGFIQRIAQDFGVSLNLRIQVAGFDAVCRMVEANVGISVLPESVAARLSRYHRIRTVRIVDQWATRYLKVCARDFTALPAFATTFVDVLRAQGEAEQI